MAVGRMAVIALDKRGISPCSETGAATARPKSGFTETVHGTSITTAIEPGAVAEHPPIRQRILVMRRLAYPLTLLSPAAGNSVNR